MGFKKNRRLSTAVLACIAIVGISSITTYAAIKYLTPDAVAEKMNQANLEEAFKGEEAVFVNETQSYGGYNVTFMGVTSGKNLDVFSENNGTSFEIGKTYAMVAIENADGTPMPDTSEDAYVELNFFVSPLIGGYNPVDYNAATMHGGYQEICEDGILYRIAECDNVEIFADHDLYLCVLDRMFINGGSYNYDEVSGEISRNETYEGLNALFDLPLDENKANPDAAKKYMEDFGKEDISGQNTEVTETVTDEGYNAEMNIPTEVRELMDKVTAENVDEYGTIIKTIVCTPDKDGYITCNYQLEGRGGGQETTLVSWLFPDGEPGMIDNMFFVSMDDVEEFYWRTYTLNEDGTVTIDIYVPKN